MSIFLHFGPHIEGKKGAPLTDLTGRPSQDRGQIQFSDMDRPDGSTWVDTSPKLCTRFVETAMVPIGPNTKVVIWKLYLIFKRCYTSSHAYVEIRHLSNCKVYDLGDKQGS